MIREIAYYPIFGKPLILYGGILTLLLFMLAWAVAYLNVKKGIHTIPFEWHTRLGTVAMILGIIHGSLAILAYYF